jgi:hypothetical protein
VFARMLPQPRLRYLLADEPGTGKTIMTGLYLAEARRRGLVPGKTVIVVPAHLVQKWMRDLDRFFGIASSKITAEVGREPQDLRPDVDVWIVSLDLYTYNDDVRRKIAGEPASWSLAVFDEAHRLTPTSQYLGAAQQLARASHHVLLLTATPHCGKEDFFRALLNVLDERLYPVLESGSSGRRQAREGRKACLASGIPHEWRAWPREESNLRAQIRSLPLYPLSYGARAGSQCSPVARQALAGAWI